MKKTLVLAFAALIAVTSCKKEDEAVFDSLGTYVSAATATFSPATMYTSFHTTTSKDSILAVVKASDSLFTFTGTALVRVPYTITFENAGSAVLTLSNRPHAATVARTGDDLLISYTDSIKIPILPPGTSYVFKMPTPESLFDSIAALTAYSTGVIGLKDTVAAFSVHMKVDNGKLYFPLLNTFNQMVKRDVLGTTVSVMTSTGKSAGVEFNTAAVKPLESGHIVIIQSGRVEMVKQ